MRRVESSGQGITTDRREADGLLGIERIREGGVEGWIVFRCNGRDTQNVEFFTRSRDAAEAFVHGYDVGRS